MFFTSDDVNRNPPKVNRHINPTSDSSALETPMDIHLQNGYKETPVKNQPKTEISSGNEEKLFNNLVKFVKDKLNTSTLSLAEFKKLLLLHPAGEWRELRGGKVKVNFWFKVLGYL